MFSTPLICCSIGVTTVEATTSALAPGYWPVTLIKGGAISGYCAIGRRTNDTAPRITKMIEITAAKIGRSMKKCEIRMLVSVGLGLIGAFAHRRGRSTLPFHRHFHARTSAHQPFDDHAVGKGEALFDDAQTIVDLAGHDVFQTDNIAVIDHEHVFARLFGADRRVGNE